MDALNDIDPGEYARLRKIHRENIREQRRRQARVTFLLVVGALPLYALVVTGAVKLTSGARRTGQAKSPALASTIEAVLDKVRMATAGRVKVSIEATTVPVEYGRSLVVRGTVRPAGSSVGPVTIQRRKSSREWETIATAKIFGKGRFSAWIRPERSERIRAIVAERGSSRSLRILVRSRVTLETSGTAFWRRPYVLKGKVSPGRKGVLVVAWVKKGGRWWSLGHPKKTDAGGSFRVSFAPETTSTLAYKVVATATPGYLSSTSMPKRVRAWYMVALTFDDGPWPPYTNEILDALRRHGARATFFPLGELVERNGDVVRRAVREGHAVGNHSYSHKILTRVSDETAREELSRTSEAVRKAAGVRPRWMRPPGGATDDGVNEIARSLGMKVAIWDVTAVDWEGSPTYATIVKRVANQVRPSDVVLMHDGGGDRSQTAKAIPAMVERLKLRGFMPVTLDELYPGTAAPRPVFPADR